MNLLTRFGLERSRFTITIMASLLVLGFALYAGFPKREDPVVVIRTAVVTSSFAGMAPERIENLVAVPIEQLTTVQHPGRLRISLGRDLSFPCRGGKRPHVCLVPA